MILGLSKKSNNSQDISVSSAYILWRSFVERNVSIGHFNVLKNLSYDTDLTLYLNHLVREYEDEIKQIEKYLIKFSINESDPSPRDLNLKSDSRQMQDQEIAEVVYRFMRLDVNVLLLSLRYGPTNEKLQLFIINLAKKSISRIDTFIRYARVKNWLFLPPDYPGLPEEITEKVSTNEIFLLWDHLIYRQTTIRQIHTYIASTEDEDMLSILNEFMDVQVKETKNLEKKLINLGVVLPQAYPNEIIMEKNKNVDDRLIYNSFLHGLQDGISLHGSAVQEVITNDRIRDYCIKITYDEIDLMVKLSHLGNKKGWANVVPSFKKQK